MPVVTANDLIKNKYVLKFGGKALTNLLFYVLGITKCNKIYDKVEKAHLKGYDALIGIIHESGLEYECSITDINRIPKEGAFIVVANHPFGMAEGMILTKIIASVRPDVKVVANFVLDKIKVINNYWLKVNPFEKKPDAFNSTTSLRECFRTIKEGHPLIIFPAGEVSTWQKGIIDCEDRSWNQPIMKFVKKANVPVLPVYIHGSNSKIFHLLGKIHWTLRLLRLPREYLNKRNVPIHLRIGLPIPVKEQERYKDLETYSKVLRLYTYALRLFYKKLEPGVLLAPEKPAPVAPPANPDAILAEIEQLRADPEKTLFSISHYTVFCSKPAKMPNIMYEIARLREISFREVGEGTNKFLDTDPFDEYFYQLFVWDDDAHKIVGSYRIGIGREIVERHGGLEGFYISSLFDFDPKMKSMMSNTLELGRSFIISEYQKKHSTLFALWRGLLITMMKTKTDYLLGAVSISGKFSEAAKALTIEFIKVNYFDYELAALTQNKEKATFRLIRTFDKETFKLITNGDFAVLDSFVQSIDPEFVTPTLVRQYISMLHTRAIGFNVDFHFNNCLDALMYLNFKTIPKKALMMLCKDLDPESELRKMIDEFPDEEE